MNRFTILLRNTGGSLWEYYTEHLLQAFMDLRIPTQYNTDTPSLVDQVLLGDMETWEVIPDTLTVVGICDNVRIPAEQVRTKCAQVDCIALPTHTAALTFLESNTKVPHFVIPFGSGEPALERIPSSGPFTFVFSSPMDGLHGAEIVVDAFTKTFANSKSTRLIVHNELSLFSDEFLRLRDKYSSPNLMWLSSQNRDKVLMLANCLVHLPLENDFSHTLYTAIHLSIPIISSCTAAVAEHLGSFPLSFVEMSDNYICRGDINPSYIGALRLPSTESLIYLMTSICNDPTSYRERAKYPTHYLPTWKEAARHIVACVVEARNLREARRQ